MATFNFELEFVPRTDEEQGKGASRRLRRTTGKVPAILYGGDEAPEMIALEERIVKKALENEAVYSHILTLTQQGKKQKVVLKDLQRHPFKPRILHMDFLRIDENKPITMHVPLHFPGQKTAPGVVDAGGTVTHHMVELLIKCLPRDLPEFIEIDLSNAPLDTVVHLSQVKLPQGVDLTTPVTGAEDDLPVVSIHMPKRIEIDEEVVEETPAAAVPSAKGGKPAAGGKGAAPAGKAPAGGKAAPAAGGKGAAKPADKGAKKK